MYSKIISARLLLVFIIIGILSTYDLQRAVSVATSILQLIRQTNSKNPLDVLGLTKEKAQDENEVKRSYKKLARKLHPDKHTKIMEEHKGDLTDEQMTSAFKALNSAKESLTGKFKDRCIAEGVFQTVFTAKGDESAPTDKVDKYNFSTSKHTDTAFTADGKHKNFQYPESDFSNDGTIHVLKPKHQMETSASHLKLNPSVDYAAKKEAIKVVQPAAWKNYINLKTAGAAALCLIAIFGTYKLLQNNATPRMESPAEDMLERYNVTQESDIEKELEIEQEKQRKKDENELREIEMQRKEEKKKLMKKSQEDAAKLTLKESQE